MQRANLGPQKGKGVAGIPQPAWVTMHTQISRSALLSRPLYMFAYVCVRACVCVGFCVQVMYVIRSFAAAASAAAAQQNQENEEDKKFFNLRFVSSFRPLGLFRIWTCMEIKELRLRAKIKRNGLKKDEANLLALLSLAIFHRASAMCVCANLH